MVERRELRVESGEVGETGKRAVKSVRQLEHSNVLPCVFADRRIFRESVADA